MSLFAVYVLAPEAQWSLIVQAFMVMGVVVGVCADWRMVTNIVLRPILVVVLSALGSVALVSGGVFGVSFVALDSVWDWSARRGCF